MSDLISMDKRYVTRDGRDVRIYAVDGGGSWPVHGATLDPNVGWDFSTWELSGKALASNIKHERDLIEVKPKITRTYWLVHFGSGRVDATSQDPRIHPHALLQATWPNQIAITGPHQVEFSEGEGIDR